LLSRSLYAPHRQAFFGCGKLTRGVTAISDDTGKTEGVDYVDEVRSENAFAAQSIVGKVIADSVSLEQSYTGPIVCERAELRQSAALSLQAESAELEQSAAASVRANEVKLADSVAGAIVAGTVSGAQVRCGVLNAERVEGQVTCLLDKWWVAALGGAAICAGFALAELLLRSRGRGQS
jgi:hypothetical protein